MDSKHDVRQMIQEAFSGVRHPGDWCLRGSDEGDEPFLTEEEFSGKHDWRDLTPEFLDNSPDGFGSALSFLSDEAFHFFIPAYLIADVEGALKNVNPSFYLYHGLLDESKIKKVNPERYGERTWFQAASHRLSVFSRPESAAIVSYLLFVRDRDSYTRDFINQALQNYWFDRAGISV
ncbi:MAG: hypothetical protein HS101_05605 [Planctomycetia bacterium]|jgi:hypothetical protein|nr:hypothetical protein [Planctomycetia bacterium]MCC7314868.1 hypothetical protein [Planctomycetota bacterium]OQZ06558.1 MAG: hypothetical protein B6D36_04400 [Planctomycetes bacterium UTPLA1]